jgi:hypothetical protein
MKRTSGVSKTGYQEWSFAFTVQIHGHLVLTEAFLLLSVNTLAHPDGRSTIEHGLF